MTILTNSEINDECTYVQNRIASYQAELFSPIDIIFRSGMREQEACRKTLWTIITDDEYKLQTLKNGGIRTFAASDLNPIFIDWLNNSAITQPLYSAERLRTAFNQFSNYPQLFVQTKEISVHLFRHNLMKQLFDAGRTYEQIKDYFQLHSVFTVVNYVNSIIYY